MTGKPYRATGASSRGTGALGPWPSKPPSLPDGVLQIEQQAAIRLRDEMLPHFLEELDAFRKVNPRIGAAVPIIVAPKGAFDIALDKNENDAWEEAFRLMFVDDFPEFERRFRLVWDPTAPPPGSSAELHGRVSPLEGVYKSPPRSFEELVGEDAKTVIPRFPLEGRPVGFYSVRSTTIWLMAGHVNAGSVAHELCHGYAANAWRVFVRRASYRRSLATHVRRLSEGVTSTLADLMIGRWKGGRMTTAGRRGDVPSGYGGYDYKHKAMASALVDLAGIDRVESAYFGGGLAVKINDKAPLRTRLLVGRVAIVLEELVARASALEGAFKEEYQ